MPDYFIKKIRVNQTRAAVGEGQDTLPYINLREIQVWVGGTNVALSDNSGHAEYAPGQPPEPWGFPAVQLNNGITDSDEDGGSTGIITGGQTPNWLQITLDVAVDINDIQSIVLYNRVNWYKRLAGATIQLLTSDDVIIYETPPVLGNWILASTVATVANRLHYRIDGNSLLFPDISANIPGGGEGEDPTIWVLPRFLSETAAYHPLDLTLVRPLTVLVPEIKKIRVNQLIEVDDAFVNLHEIEVWVDGSNVAASAAGAIAEYAPGQPEVAFGFVASNLNNGNLTDVAHTMIIDGTVPNYVQIILDNAIHINDIESVIVYNRQGQPQRLKGTTIQLLNVSDVIIAETPPLGYGFVNDLPASLYYRLDSSLNDLPPDPSGAGTTILHLPIYPDTHERVFATIQYIKHFASENILAPFFDIDTNKISNIKIYYKEGSNWDLVSSLGDWSENWPATGDPPVYPIDFPNKDIKIECTYGNILRIAYWCSEYFLGVDSFERLYYTEAACAGGDPYVTTLSGITYKMANFTGFSRMLQGTLQDKPFTLNTETTLLTKEELIDLIISRNKLFSEKLINNYEVDEFPAYFSKLHASWGDDSVTIDLKTFEIIQSTTNEEYETKSCIGKQYNWSKKKTKEEKMFIPFGPVTLVVKKNPNLDIRNGFTILGSEHIENKVGGLVKPMYVKDIKLKSLTTMKLIKDVKDRTPKKTIKQEFHTKAGEVIKKEFHIY